MDTYPSYLFKLRISSILNAFLWSTFLDPPQTQLSYKTYRAILRHIFIPDTLKAWFTHVHINVYAQFLLGGAISRFKTLPWILIILSRLRIPKSTLVSLGGGIRLPAMLSFQMPEVQGYSWQEPLYLRRLGRVISSSLTVRQTCQHCL